MITLVGVFAAVMTTACWFPQVMRTLRTRSAHDFSWIYLIALTIGVASWATYGILREDVAIALANSLTLIVLVTIVIVKLRSERRARA